MTLLQCDHLAPVRPGVRLRLTARIHISLLLTGTHFDRINQRPQENTIRPLRNPKTADKLVTLKVTALLRCFLASSPVPFTAFLLGN
jgi:hypothetical protein